MSDVIEGFMSMDDNFVFQQESAPVHCAGSMLLAKFSTSNSLAMIYQSAPGFNLTGYRIYKVIGFTAASV